MCHFSMNLFWERLPDDITWLNIDQNKLPEYPFNVLIRLKEVSNCLSSGKNSDFKLYISFRIIKIGILYHL